MIVHRNSQRGTLIAVAAIIAGGVVAGVLLGRGADAPLGQPAAAVASAGSAPPDAPPTAAPVAVPVSVPAETDIAKLAEASMAGPRESRLAAIEELSKASREQALEPLKRVLLNGEPGTDRPAALHGLRELALSQGDADGRIRDIVREVIYHGDDEGLAAEAQETLDIIGESESK